MATITAVQLLTLDGVMQGPGRPDEDTRDGFALGGWAEGYRDDATMEFLGVSMSASSGMLFGHRSYLDLLSHWTAVTEPNPFTEILTGAPKWVTSRSAGTVLEYPNSTLLAGEATDTVARLKKEVDGDLTVLGSGELTRALHAAGLVDGYLLQIHPIVLGSGTRLFAEGERADLRLERSVTTGTGVVLAEYSVKR